MGIGLFQAEQLFLGLPTIVADPHLIDALQPQSFLPYGYRHPQGPLVVFESIPGDPGGATGELYGIENDKNIAEVCQVEKSGERRKIWPAGGYNHGFTVDEDINQKRGTTLSRKNRN